MSSTLVDYWRWVGRNFYVFEVSFFSVIVAESDGTS